jgi:fructokinase
MAAATTYDILGIGNAIVDVVARADDGFLAREAMRKGSMNLVDAEAAEALYARMPPGIESSGGSAANTCAVAASLGARVAYLGKVADDQLGKVFRHDIEAAGVFFPSAPLVGAAPTARCLILVTPDAERTMTVYLGACVAFAEADVDADVVAASAVTYLEGYLFDPPSAQAAFRVAARSVWIAIAPRFANWCVATWISCSPTKPKSAACTRPPISTPPPHKCVMRWPWRR